MAKDGKWSCRHTSIVDITKCPCRNKENQKERQCNENKYNFIPTLPLSDCNNKYLWFLKLLFCYFY